MERTFFITSVTWGRRAVFQNDERARLLLDVLYHYRPRYLLHEFVIMPDHIHLIITPGLTLSLERAVQLIKGSFSFRAGRQDVCGSSTLLHANPTQARFRLEWLSG
jgi:putative transposase